MMLKSIAVRLGVGNHLEKGDTMTIIEPRQASHKNPAARRIALLLLLTAPLLAAQAEEAPAWEFLDHPMGSQIRLREGGAGFHSYPLLRPERSVPGMDVSGYQGNVDWESAWAEGARFAYIKATEGTYYRNPYFTQQYNGSYDVGMIRGAYHFANPSDSSGAEQAEYFVAHGGGWSPDGKTLPGTLDIEWNPYGSACYDLSQSAMIDWIDDFVTTYKALTSRWPVIYTSTSWWSQCTGNLADFSDTDALWVARYASDVGALPYDWADYTFWQYSDSGIFPGDQDLFNGSLLRLFLFALVR